MTGVQEPPARAWHGWRWLALVSIAYFALLFVSLEMAVYRQGVSVFSFAAPVGAVALLAVPRQKWPLVMLALAAAALAAYGRYAQSNLATDPQMWSKAMSQAVVSLFEVSASAWLLDRWGQVRREDLYAPQRLSRLLMLGAVLPVAASAVLANLFTRNQEWQVSAETAASWMVGHTIGALATLPICLVLWLRSREELRSDFLQPQALPLLLLSVGVTVGGAVTLPHPFVVMIIPLVAIALNAGLALTALAGWLTALIVVALLHTGVLLAPPSSAWWSDMLYFGALLAALIPGLFLASSVEGRAAVMRQISDNEQRYRRLYAETPAMMHAADVTDSIGGPIVSVSERWLKVTGYRRDEVIGHRFAEFLPPETIRLANEVVIPQVLRDGSCEDFEAQIRAADGRILDILFSAVLERDTKGNPVRAYAVLQDITEKKLLAAKSHFAEHDALTGLPNRVLLNDRLERACAHHERYGGSFAVGFVDLDHFKSINDSFGHEAGDFLLQEIARRLQEALRATDTVCRLGGDEFVLLFTQADDAQDLEAVAAKVLRQVAQPLILTGVAGQPEIAVSASVGVAIFPQHARTPQDLLQRADEAMYQSKRDGRNRCLVYSPPATN